jgi:hypothetical protein
MNLTLCGDRLKAVKDKADIIDATAEVYAFD